jgi:DNA-binding SARP family transcriptional activator
LVCLVVGFGLLGPVEVWAGSTRVQVGPPRQRAVLAGLAVDAGRVVPVDVLVDRVWGPDPPARVRRTLHTHIARVRRVVEQVAAAGGGPVRVVRRADGYALDVDPDRVDLLRFRRLGAEARRGERSDAERVGLLDEALGLWRGVPLAGLSGEWAGRQRDSWRLERLEAVLEWARAGLRLGQHAQVIPVARDLGEQYPHNEALAVVLGWALAADGRRDEATDHCASVSHRLRTELGTDPGPALRELQQATCRARCCSTSTAPPRSSRCWTRWRPATRCCAARSATR